MGSVDIRFIASKAGVSPATVSRVLNHSKPVGEETRRRVMKEVEKYGYRPNMLARGLIIRKSNLIGVVTPNVSSYFHARMIASVEEVAAQHGYNVIVTNVSTDYQRERESIRIFAERRVDGIILMHENSVAELHELIEIAGVPIVIASANVQDCPLPTVGIDDRCAAYDATSYLMRLGHRNIGAIFNDCYSLNVLRREGFFDALRQYGVTPNPQWIRVGECRIQAGRELASQIFSGSERPTALFCVSDEQAVGAVNVLMELGYRIPQDVSVIGVDDVELGTVLIPTLTTVRQPIEEIGAKACTILLEWLASGVVPQNVVFPHMLIVRHSTGRTDAQESAK